MTLFKGQWESVIQLANDFEIAVEDITDRFEVLFAYYNYIDWSGEAYVLLREKATGDLFEVFGSHCSCFGLEGQWEPEETSKAAILYSLQYSLKKHEKDLYPIICAFSEKSSFAYVAIKLAKNFGKGYFVSLEPEINWKPAVPNVKDSTCIVYEEKVIPTHTILDESKPDTTQDEYERTITYKRNTAILEDWQKEGTNHVIEQKGNLYELYREKEQECVRTTFTDWRDLHTWLQEHSGQFMDGKDYNILEADIIVLGDR